MRFLVTGLRVFADQLSDHVAHGPCEACSRPTTLVTAPDALRMAA
jgi:hypothetical protein